MKAKPRACCPRTIRCWPPPATWAASTGWAKSPGVAGSYEAPAARCRHRLALGQPELARGDPAGMRAGVPHPLRQFRQARPHLERMVRAAHQPRRIADHQSQRALHPVEGGVDRRERRDALLNSVTLAYLPQNSPPVVKSINVITRSRPPLSCRKPRSRAPRQPIRVTVTDTGDASAGPRPAHPRRRFRARPPADQRHAGRPKIPMATAWSTPSTSAAKTRRSGSCCKQRHAREHPHVRRRYSRRRQVFLPRGGLRPRGQSAAQRARRAT